MNTTALRQKILDLAIHGKLVKQDPTDENAAVLLEKIRAEKEKKIASGELKRDKNDSYIFIGDDNRHYEKFADGRIKDIEDELPFAVPEGWAWCRLGEIADIARGGSPRPIEDFITDEANGINWIKIGDTAPESKYIISAKEKIKPEGKKHSRFVHAGDFLLTNSMSFGRPYILKINGCIHDGWLVFADIRNYLLKDFLYYGLSSQYIYSSFSLVAAGSTVKNLKANTVKQVLFPLPPLTEQQRIVNIIEAIFAQIDLLEQNKRDLQTAIKQAKSKILDLAIHGKLVPQDPNDELASVMLEKLRAEKEAKIAAGKMKRDKNDSYIYKNAADNCYYEKIDGKNDIRIDDELLFELPKSWQWTKLGRICDKLIDGDHNPPKGIEEKTEYIMVSSRNINYNTVADLENVRYLTKEMFEAENLRTNATAGDILFTSVGSLGRSCIYDGSLNICFQRSVSILKTAIYNKYLKFFFDSKFYQNYVVEHATGTAQTGFYLQEMAESFIAIPPILEQKRIVAKIEELFNALDKIQNNLI
ncbi:restriction endonuclease subunit S [Treponema vincentii]|uniref:restriction endonuclease subunit S n=1 Tax=Treponema vincentii TaxID=69710 RepID=UPI003D947868